MKPRQPRFRQIFGKRENTEEMAAYAAVAWAEVIEHLEENGLTTKTRIDTARRYVLARTEHEFLYPEAMAEGPTITAGSGGEYANMKWSAVGKLNEQIMKFEDSLLISPRAADGKVERKKPASKKTGADEFLSAGPH